MTEPALDLTTHPARRLRSLSIASVLALVIVGGCSGGGSGGAETSPSTVVATTEVAPPTLAATTTAAPVLVLPTVAPPTIPAPAPAFLRGNGLDTFDFGAPAALVVAGITLPMMSDRQTEFPVNAGDGFQSLDSSQYFITQFGRELCWNDGNAGTLCAYFGGADLISQVFVGWHYSAPEGVEGVLFSTSAVTVNILASSNPAITLTGGACFSFTTVLVDEIGVDLLSVTGGFGDGIPADTRVTAMSAGNVVISLVDSGDC
ncbi:MAG: hypothetical protein HY826_05165 [Actinobacteria bacterium]|nr:hypothetical protein [Actinomycetota bacterium]